jgi:hypothetical protein
MATITNRDLVIASYAEPILIPDVNNNVVQPPHYNKRLEFRDISV